MICGVLIALGLWFGFAAGAVAAFYYVRTKEAKK